MIKTSIATQTYLIILLCCLSFFANAQLPAFPGAEGYGRFATGGRLGDVYHVANLHDDGSGSLRYGLETARGPRTIVFDISGNILLSKKLVVNASNLTIAGQTAPGGGITLAGNSLYIKADDVIIRYIRVRFGDKSGQQADAISIIGGKNIILDHVSASWSIDETLSCQSDHVDLLTVQWCMISESLQNSLHKKGSHGYGGIIGATRQSFHHNLYAHHSSRSPKVTGRRHCEVDFRNNVIYNWGFNNCYDGTASYMNWVNNYYKPGPATEQKVTQRIFQLSDAEIADVKNNSPKDSKVYETALYAEGNFVVGSPDVTKDNWAGGIDFVNGASEVKNRAKSPAFPAPMITQQTALNAYPLVVASAGASFSRDAIDQRIAQEVLTGTYTYGKKGLIDSPNDVKGLPLLTTLPPPLDTDQDGMPDEWEKKNSLDPNEPDDRNHYAATGYTMLEVYLNELLSNTR
ncbi:pectate lyase family protein [Sphingobacterium athyrii]|uniref:Pectate lyase n=1 Tax=Sphingobacterium athyrii TaxID=2152717 RepID=A0A363NX29_9SPHI|nr:pectate lyase [Sphingobacterium athyrii]PUV25290.1 pectate lyase [Sphingobacterium athyrii]